jgi:hypothetical protein
VPDSSSTFSQQINPYVSKEFPHEAEKYGQAYSTGLYRQNWPSITVFGQPHGGAPKALLAIAELSEGFAEKRRSMKRKNAKRNQSLRVRA